VEPCQSLVVSGEAVVSQVFRGRKVHLQISGRSEGADLLDESISVVLEWITFCVIQGRKNSLRPREPLQQNCRNYLLLS